MENDSSRLDKEIDYDIIDEFDQKDLEIITEIIGMYKPSEETKKRVKKLIRKKKLKKKTEIFKYISAVTVILFLMPFTHTGKSLVKIMKHTGGNIEKIKVLINKQKIKRHEFNLIESNIQLQRKENIAEIKEKLNFEPVVLGKKYKHIMSEMDENGKSNYLYSFYKLDGKPVRIFQRLLNQYEGRVYYSGKMEKKIIDGVNVNYIENVGFEYEKEGVVIEVDYEGGSYKEYVRIFRDLKRLK